MGRPLKTIALILPLLLTMTACGQAGMAVVAGGHAIAHASANGQGTLTGWGNCVSTGCAGGAGNTTGVNQTIGVASPSVSGASMSLAATFPASGNNVLYYWKPGSCDTCEWVVFDTWVYVPASVANYEFDSFIIDQTDNVDAMFGKQCNTVSGYWQYANQTSAWTNGPIACSLSTSTWHHLIFSDYWVHGDTSCVGGMPCLHFGTIQIDGVTSSWGGTTIVSTVLPGGWTRTYGCQFQMDSSAGASVTEYVDNVNCWVGK